MEIYKRYIKYHDRNAKLFELTVKIQKFDEIAWYCNFDTNHVYDFCPKQDSQTKLENFINECLWGLWHIDRIQEFINLCDDICNRIEEEEHDYIKNLDYYSEYDIKDNKIIALIRHLDITGIEAIIDIEKKEDYIYTYGTRTYLVVTDEEADKLFEEELAYYFSDIILNAIPKQYHNYFDTELWKKDMRKQGRGHFLSTYNGNEDLEVVDNTDYYIYRTS